MSKVIREKVKISNESRKVDSTVLRAYTNALLEDAENGVLDWEELARAALAYMSEDDVKHMAQNDFDYEDDDDDEFVEECNHIVVKEDSSDNNRSRAESLKLTADYFLGQLRGLCDKINKDDREGSQLFYKNANSTLKDLVRQFEDLKANF